MNQLIGAKTPFYVCQTVLPMAFSYIKLKKREQTMCFCDRLLPMKIQCKIGSLIGCLLCVHTTLVHF